MITTINEFKQELEQIRISCAGLAQIIIDGKYLLLLNNSALKRGEYTYTPLGGALEYYDSSKSFLDTFVLKYEKNKDLRLFINKIDLNKYVNWFNSRSGREVTIERELIEEFVQESKILDALSISDFTSTYLKVINDNEYYNDIMNYRYFEIFSVEFNDNIKEILIHKLNESNMIYLATKQEIESGKTDTGIKIGSNCKAIL